MHNILCLNKISPLGTDRLGENYTYAAEIENPEGILVRSAAMHDMELPNSLLAIARAGAGVNNIPVEKCAEAGIVVFNTPGANANAVKELVLCAMLMGSRDVDGGIQWVRQQVASGVDVTTVVEKGKAAFIVREDCTAQIQLFCRVNDLPEDEWALLGQLDLGDITDVINTERKNAFHEDEVIQEFTPDELIEPNAPDFQCGGVAVPRVVE